MASFGYQILGFGGGFTPVDTSDYNASFITVAGGGGGGGDCKWRYL